VVQRAIEAGFLGYFAKPIDVAHFVQDLEAHVTQQMLEAYVSNSIHGFQQGAEAPC
jgi:response regulator of citrate/malate metabolism